MKKTSILFSVENSKNGSIVHIYKTRNFFLFFTSNLHLILFILLHSKLNMNLYIFFPVKQSESIFFLKLLANILSTLIPITKDSHLYFYREPYWYIHNYLLYKKITFFNLSEDPTTWPSQSLKDYSYIITYEINKQTSFFECNYEKRKEILPIYV